MAEAKWSVRVSREVRDDANKLPEALVHFIIDSVRILECENPMALTRPSAPPAQRPGYQIFEFDMVLEGKWHWFTAFIRFDESAKHIQIHMIGHVEYQKPSG